MKTTQNNPPLTVFVSTNSRHNLLNFIRSVKLRKVLFGKPEKPVSVWMNQGNTALKDLKVEKSNEVYGDVQSLNSSLRVESDFFTKQLAVFAGMAAVGVFYLPQYAKISTLTGT